MRLYLPSHWYLTQCCIQNWNSFALNALRMSDLIKLHLINYRKSIIILAVTWSSKIFNLWRWHFSVIDYSLNLVSVKHTIEESFEHFYDICYTSVWLCTQGHRSFSYLEKKKKETQESRQIYTSKFDLSSELLCFEANNFSSIFIFRLNFKNSSYIKKEENKAIRCKIYSWQTGWGNIFYRKWSNCNQSQKIPALGWNEENTRRRRRIPRIVRERNDDWTTERPL